MRYTDIISFDKTEHNKASLIRPEKYSDLFSLSNEEMIARGAGLSYCNASVSEKGISIDLSSFNRILNFSPENETITVEAGISIGDLNNFITSRGWIMPVLPGYPSITVGGCIAFNVHGKSQYNIGNFKDWVNELTLFHPLYGELLCSKHNNQELLDLTIGGIGLTGIITSATLKIKKLLGNNLEIKAVKATDFADAVKIMNENAVSFDYIYSWNDLNLKGRSFGKGLVYLEKYNSSFKTYKPKKYHNNLQYKVKFYNLHSKLTIQMMCALYYTMERIKPATRQVSVISASFPIYGKEIYYYFLGRRGFREYQVIFNNERWEPAVEELKKTIAETRIPIALGSLKVFRGARHNISFAGEGVCITIDVPNNINSLDFFQRLDEITLKYGGIINLSKDSRASSELVSSVFPQYGFFKQKISEFDPNHSFRSTLSKRIGIS